MEGCGLGWAGYLYVFLQGGELADIATFLTTGPKVARGASVENYRDVKKKMVKAKTKVSKENKKKNVVGETDSESEISDEEEYKDVKKKMDKVKVSKENKKKKNVVSETESDMSDEVVKAKVVRESDSDMFASDEVAEDKVDKEDKVAKDKVVMKKEVSKAKVVSNFESYMSDEVSWEGGFWGGVFMSVCSCLIWPTSSCPRPRPRWSRRR